MQSVVILGGTGFVGRHLCAHFARLGHRVTAVARRPAAVPGADETIALDVAAEPRRLAALVAARDTGTVVNAAGALWAPAAEPEMTWSNAVLVERLVAVLAGLPRPPRLIQLGTVHEYGEVPAGRRIDETLPCRPGTPYGRTKLRATAAVLEAAGREALPATVLRLSNVLGPGIPADSLPGRVLAALTGHRVAGEPVRVELHALTAERDFVDVRDVAAAVAAAAAAVRPCPLAVVGSGRAVPVRQVVRSLMAHSRVPAHLVEHEPVAVTGRAVGGRQELDIRTARRELGWAPQVTLADSLTELWADADARART